MSESESQVLKDLASIKTAIYNARTSYALSARYGGEKLAKEALDNAKTARQLLDNVIRVLESIQ